MRIRTALALLFCAAQLFAINPPGLNATAVSLGGSSAAYPSLYGINSNIAAFRADENISLNVGNYFGLSEYSAANLTGGFAVKGTQVGISYSVLPIANLQIRQSRLGVSRQLSEQVWAGVGMAYYNLVSNDNFYQNGSVFTANIGILYQPVDKLSIGLSVDNPTRSKLSNTLNERMPSSVRLGLAYELSESIQVYGDAFQQTDYPLDLQAGLEYNKDHYALRAGFSSLNETLSVGGGYQAKNLSINIAASYHNRLGISPFLTLGYAFN